MCEEVNGATPKDRDQSLTMPVPPSRLPTGVATENARPGPWRRKPARKGNDLPTLPANRPRYRRLGGMTLCLAPDGSVDVSHDDKRNIRVAKNPAALATRPVSKRNK